MILTPEPRGSVNLAPPPSATNAPIHLWELDAGFHEMWKKIADRTIVDPVRCFLLYQFCRQTRSVPGDLAEVGVYRGGTARLLAEAAHGSKALHLFDTFSGMPATNPAEDLHLEGQFHDTSLEAVCEFLRRCDNVELYPGWFPGTATLVECRRFSMVHVDADIHQSVLDCCRFFYPRMNRGGLMVFDDYGFPSCPGARTAVDSFFADRLEHPVYLPTGQCVVTKI